MKFGERVNEFGDHLATSISDLLGIMKRNLYSTESRWIYRGQADVEWDIVPSIGRLYKTDNFRDISKLNKFEKDAFSEFLVRTYSEYRTNNKIANLAIAQHHGLKTRMLDWTFSPLYAIFFAVEDEKHYDKDGVVYAYENKEYNNYNSSTFDPFKEETYCQDYYFIFAPSHSPRIKAQLGVFQIFRNPHKEFSRPYNFHRITIPKTSKGDIKQELFRLGISYDLIFPEVDGIASSINYYKLNK